MNIKIFKRGFNYGQDGTGNRLVLHMQGCNLQCAWCSNPEGLALDGCLLVNPDKLLAEICPAGAIHSRTLDRNRCKTCSHKACLHENKNEGLRLSCQTESIESLFDEILSAKSLFFGGGGVTFSGGEPTLQFRALKSLLILLKNAGIHTAIETNATHGRLSDLFPLLDLLIIDFKHYDAEIHKQYTGFSNTVIKANIIKAVENHPNVWIRTPLINGFNAEQRFIPGFIDFFSCLPCENTHFEFLKYHEYGKVKWEQCGMSYTVVNGEVENGIEEAFKNSFLENKFKLIMT
ncbi:MAG: glycyl-radical enzyme activating protein [Chloroflexota bacterium]